MLSLIITSVALASDQELGFGTDLVLAARTKIFPSVEAARAFFGSSFAQDCAPNDLMCPYRELASDIPGYACPQAPWGNVKTHQKVLCQYDGTWLRQPAMPTDCEFNDKYQCQAPSNNCWLYLSSNCQDWCTCWNHESNSIGGGVTSRLGSGLLGTAQDVPVTKYSQKTSGGGASQCPWWLPSAYKQRTGGFQISCNQQAGTFCSYPNARMNFVCSGYNGVWQLQGKAPTPIPTPAPVQNCPGWWWIWSGITPCSREGRFCSYPKHHTNYVCNNGFWQEQGNPPAPTPPPTQPPTNSPECPSDEHWLQRGNYCSTPNQKCSYPNNVTWVCNKNGVWTEFDLASGH